MYGYNDYRNYLAHHGVKGMKWGVRKQQKYANRFEKNPTKRNFKKLDKITTKNQQDVQYKKLMSNEDSFYKNDQQFKQTSQNAFNAEKQRRLHEEKILNKNGYKDWSEVSSQEYFKINDQLYKDKQYLKLLRESEKAADLKNKRRRSLEHQFVKKISDSKIKDYGITKNQDIAKKYIEDNLVGFKIVNYHPYYYKNEHNMDNSEYGRKKYKVSETKNKTFKW